MGKFVLVTMFVALGLVMPAQAKEPGVVTMDVVRDAVGMEVTEEQLAALTDVSEEFGADFEQPTSVYTGGIYLDLDGSELGFNVDTYVQDGVARGIDMYFYPADIDFWDYTFEEQQAIYDQIYWHIVDNYAGEEGGTNSYYDETGGLYTYKDPGDIIWTLRWNTAASVLVLSFDVASFYDEHYIKTVLRDNGLEAVPNEVPATPSSGMGS